MTARAWLDRRVRWVSVPATAGVLVFMAAVALSQVLGPAVVLAAGLPGFGLALAAGLVAHCVLLRCPGCRGNLAALVWAGGWRADPRVRFCPYCGTDLDAELPAGRSGE